MQIYFLTFTVAITGSIDPFDIIEQMVGGNQVWIMRSG